MAESHTLSSKVIHWSFVLLYGYGIVKQIDDLSQLEDTGLLLFEVMFASVFLILVIMRYLYMRRFETFLGAREPVPIVHTYLAKTVHAGMYLCLILLPLSGLVIAGLFTQGHTNEEGFVLGLVLGVHGFSADLSYVLIAIHVGAALYSRLKGDGIWASMVPVLKDTAPTNNSFIKTISSTEEKIYAKAEQFFSSKKQ